jgi:hypothetical protein
MTVLRFKININGGGGMKYLQNKYSLSLPFLRIFFSKSTGCWNVYVVLTMEGVNWDPDNMGQ